MLILDLEVLHKIGGLVRRAAERPLSRLTVEHQIARLRRCKSVNFDPSLCVLVREGYLLFFCFEDAPGMGLARHLAVSCGKPGERPARAAVEMLTREVGITSPPADLVCWFQPVAGRGTAVHLLEALTPLNSVGLPLALRQLIEDQVPEGEAA